MAGIHRLLGNRQQLYAASVVIVIAGMEGALPSVVAGLIDKPVIAVPTSVGYGASFNGLAALLAMLNSCASGITVVNIDNGFGRICGEPHKPGINKLSAYATSRGLKKVPKKEDEITAQSGQRSMAFSNNTKEDAPTRRYHKKTFSRVNSTPTQ